MKNNFKWLYSCIFFICPANAFQLSGEFPIKLLLNAILMTEKSLHYVMGDNAISYVTTNRFVKF